MDKIKKEQTTWDNIYKKGRMLKHIPSDRAIMAFLNNLPQDKKNSEIRILEVGCGSASNLFFTAERGFTTAGVDIAPTAIEYAQKRFDDAGLKTDLSVGSFYPLKFEDESFDFVIDSGALVCVDMNDCKEAISEINRVLKKGGKFFFTPFSDRHSSAVSGVGIGKNSYGKY